MMQNQKQTKIQQITIPALHTYMIQEVDSSSIEDIKVSLLSGEAEILGMKMKRHYHLKFRMPCIILIFTWEGCEISAEWPEDKNSKSSEDWLDITLHNHVSESPMIKYLNLHYELTIARRLAQEKFRRGPRLAIVGGENSGLAYSSRLMLAWAGKLNMQPVYVDLDLENSLFLDGSVGTCVCEYKVCRDEDVYRHCQKLCMLYGNRRIRTSSFLNTARQLAKSVNFRLNREQSDVKWKGTHQEICSFASGLVLQCPRVSDEKKNIKEMLAELFVIFGITHVLVIDNPDLSSFISRNCPDIIKEVAPKLEGIDNLSKLPKSTKIKNYFGEHKVVTEKLSFEEAIVYEIIEEEHRSPYVRTVDIRTELVNKTGVAILEAERGSPGEEPQQIAQRILQSVALQAIRISRIGENDVTFDVKFKGDLEKYKKKIWVSMIAEKCS